MAKFNSGVSQDLRYNNVPDEISPRQMRICSGCAYRVYRMQEETARAEARVKGGSVRNYMQGFYLQPIPSCKRRQVCLVDNLAVSRGKTSASNRKNDRTIYSPL